jgi:hypothetical protein
VSDMRINKMYLVLIIQLYVVQSMHILYLSVPSYGGLATMTECNQKVNSN